MSTNPIKGIFNFRKNKPMPLKTIVEDSDKELNVMDKKFINLFYSRFLEFKEYTPSQDKFIHPTDIDHMVKIKELIILVKFLKQNLGKFDKTLKKAEINNYDYPQGIVFCDYCLRVLNDWESHDIIPNKKFNFLSKCLKLCGDYNMPFLIDMKSKF